jgi:hypothetical protein
MKVFRLFFIACLVLLSASCSLKPTWDVVGKWEKVGGKETLEFTRDGMVNYINGVVTLNAHYRFTDEKHLKIDLGGLGSLSMKASVAKDAFTLTDSEGKSTEFRKLK